MKDRKNAATLRETQIQLQKKVCSPPVESRSCYISCYATQQPVCCAGLRRTQLHQCQLQPAAQLIGLTSPLLSFPLICFSPTSLVSRPFLSFCRPLSVLCAQRADWGSGRSCGVWILPRGVQMVLSLPAASFRSISVYLSCQSAWLFACLCLCVSLRPERRLFKFPWSVRKCILSVSFWEWEPGFFCRYFNMLFIPDSDKGFVYANSTEPPVAADSTF